MTTTTTFSKLEAHLETCENPFLFLAIMNKLAHSRFKMQEAELNLWFDENREELVRNINDGAAICKRDGNTEMLELLEAANKAIMNIDLFDGLEARYRLDKASSLTACWYI